MKSKELEKIRIIVVVCATAIQYSKQMKSRQYIERYLVLRE